MPKKTQRLSSGTHRARTEEKVKVITELRRKYPLEDLLQFLSVPRSTYYYYLKQSKKEDKYFVEKQEIKAIFETNKARYGYRRILAVLRQKGYIRINEIAETCGFDDHAYFCRVFKKETGLAPNEFQLRLLEDNKIYPVKINNNEN